MLESIESMLETYEIDHEKLSRHCMASFLYIASLHLELSYGQIMTFTSAIDCDSILQQLKVFDEKLALEFEMYLRVAFPEEYGRNLESNRFNFTDIFQLLAELPFYLSYFFQVVRCSRLMARGQYSEARAGIEFLNHEASEVLKTKQRLVPVPLFFVLRSYIVLGISSQSQGDYKLAKRALASQQKILSIHNDLGLRIAFERRCLSLQIERENYVEALKISHLLLLENVRERASHAILIIVIQEKIKLHLALGQLSQVHFFLDRLREELASETPGEEVILPIEPQCEMALLSSSSGTSALTVIEPMLGRVKVSGYFNAEVVASIYLTRALISNRDWKAASLSSAQACYIGKRFGYGRDYLRLLILNFFAFAQLGQRADATRVLMEASSLANQLELRSSQLIISILRFSLFEKVHPFTFQPSLIEHNQVESAIFFCRNIFSGGTEATEDTQVKRVLKAARVSKNALFPMKLGESKLKGIGQVFIRSFTGKTQKVSLLEVFSEMLQSGISYFSVTDNLVISFKKNYLRRSDLKLSQVELSVFVRLHEVREKGLTLEDIFKAIYPDRDFHLLRHAPKIYTVISKLKQAIEETSEDLKISKKQIGAETVYFLCGKIHLLTTEYSIFKPSRLSAREQPLLEALSKSTKVGKGSHDDRHAQILALLQLRESSKGLSGAELARVFGVSRQALHRDLKELHVKGKIEIIKKGRYSKYLVC